MQPSRKIGINGIDMLLYDDPFVRLFEGSHVHFLVFGSLQYFFVYIGCLESRQAYLLFLVPQDDCLVVCFQFLLLHFRMMR